MGLRTWIAEGVEEGIKERVADANPIARGVVQGAYETLTGRELALPRRRRNRPWSMRAKDGTPWSFRQNGRVLKLKLNQQPAQQRPQRRSRVR